MTARQEKALAALLNSSTQDEAAGAAGRMKPNCAGASGVLVITDCEDSKAYFEAAGLLDDLEGSEENDGEGL